MAEENNPRIFRLRILGPDVDREIVLTQGEKILGRDASCEIQLAHSFVSRRHAQLSVGADECQLVDLESHNGTNVDGVALQPHQAVILRSPSTIVIGPFELTFEQVALAPHKGVPTGGEDQDSGDAQPIPPVDPIPAAEEPGKKEREAAFPPGLSTESLRLLQYLPPIYHTEFMSSFLALFKSILLPIEWNVDNFDLYLSPDTAPAGFLPWLANWFEIAAHPAWNEAQRRAICSEADCLYARRGTRWALSRVLEILTGQAPEIIEFEDGQRPYTFTVRLRTGGKVTDQRLLESLISMCKPAHTHCILETI